MVGSVFRKDLSVKTPSIAGTMCYQKTSASSYVHISNPNPQNGKHKYKNVRDHGYHSVQNSPSTTSRAGLSLITTPLMQHKFGKRVFLADQKLTDREVFELHMKQIRTKGSVQNFDREMKIREEQEFTRFV